MASRSNASPADLFGLGLNLWSLWAESTMVMGMRMMGMAGAWAVAPSESMRMVTEKGPAFAKAGLAGTQAAMRGARPDQIAQAALRPLTRTAKANRRRLQKAGPKLPGA